MIDIVKMAKMCDSCKFDCRFQLQTKRDPGLSSLDPNMEIYCYGWSKGISIEEQLQILINKAQPPQRWDTYFFEKFKYYEFQWDVRWLRVNVSSILAIHNKEFEAQEGNKSKIKSLLKSKLKETYQCIKEKCDEAIESLGE